jgi:hypothetical protein
MYSVGMVTEQDSTTPEERREALRAEIVRAHVPVRYSPTVHMLIPSVLGISVMIAAVWLLRDPRWTDVLAVPITLLFGWAFEWRAHKDILHQRRPGLGVLYERHELAHHVIYTYDNLAMRNRRELFLILMPPYAIVLVFAMVIPIAGLVFLFSGLNAALLTTATSMAFFLSYEWLHFSYHQPPESFIGRLRLVRVLREFHRRHHDPRLMKRWNFNVTFPVFDLVHRTVWSPEREAARNERRRGLGVHGERVPH